MTDARGALWHPSPNFGPRRDDARVELIVLHYTAMATAEAARDRLCDPDHQVSAHYLIAEDGRLWQLVSEEMRAWHAGAGSWAGRGDVNSRSIGIELANDGSSPFAARLMDRLEALLTALLADHALSPLQVIGHSDMAPERKHDPGPRFDWRRLARQGLSIWPALTPDHRPGPVTDSVTEQDQADLSPSLATFGYPGAAEADLLAAFRARFRPGATGPCGQADRKIAAALARNHFAFAAKPLAIDPGRRAL